MVYVLLANGFETIEALTPVDYLRRCKDVPVQTVAVGDSKTVVSSHQVPVEADILLKDVSLEDAEMIVLPGGLVGTKNLEESDGVQKLIDYCVEQDRWVTAICAAPSILGHKGLLKGRKATSFRGFDKELLGADYTGEPVERDGKFITGRGAGVSNQFAFALVRALRGEERAKEIAHQVFYAG